MDTLVYGDFVKVKRNSDFRSGQDGMVMSAQDGEGNVGMVFWYDRYGQSIPSPCEGIELWHVDELDLPTAER